MKKFKLIPTLKKLNYCPDSKVKLKEYCDTGRILYDGKISDLLDYIKDHDDLNVSDGFPVQVKNIRNWSVGEILTDLGRRGEDELPRYNKSKILMIY